MSQHSFQDVMAEDRRKRLTRARVRSMVYVQVWHNQRAGVDVGRHHLPVGHKGMLLSLNDVGDTLRIFRVRYPWPSLAPLRAPRDWTV